MSLMTTEDPTILKQISANKCFEGVQYVYEHFRFLNNNELKCNMKFAAYVPKKEPSEKLTFLVWLSGLTCNEQNFITKAGFHRFAQKHKICVIAPDTSPRGCNIVGESERWDFGVGAGFYVDATEEKWKNNFRMYSYVNFELHDVIRKNFNNDSSADFKISIFGHSMGGHGAITGFLKNPGKYKSVSAFAPICNPVNCEWGKFAFNGYLGSNSDAWNEYDSCSLLKAYKGPSCSILIDQGGDDQFLKANQLLPENLAQAAKENALTEVNLRLQEGYDHSYYFIATFIEEHFDFHAKHLKN